RGNRAGSIVALEIPGALADRGDPRSGGSEGSLLHAVERSADALDRHLECDEDGEVASRRFRVRVISQRDGYVLATCGSPVCLSRARSEAEALEKIRAEIRYRIEWCPCTGVDEDYVQLEVERDAATTR